MNQSTENINHKTSSKNAKEVLEEKHRLFLLKQILLKEDRDELEQLRKTLDDPELLSQKVAPIIEDHFDFLKKNFPEEFRYAVEGIIEKKLDSSQERLLDVLYPKIGLMIKKYVQYEIQTLQKNIEELINKILNQGPIGRLKYALFGKRPSGISKVIFRGINKTTIEEVYVIEHHSGILLGSASKKESIDLEVIAGMLTAIKSFVEDAFKRGNEELEMIQYGTFSILIQNFHSYYIAAALVGNVRNEEKAQLSEDLLRFAESELKFDLRKQDGSSNFKIKQKLEKHFFEPQKAILQQKEEA